MKAFGVPRRLDVEHPDMADARLYGMAISTQSTKAKAESRRIWKKKARAQGNAMIRREIFHQD